jgi:hypothetical protein
MTATMTVRPVTERRPVHLAVLIGASAGAYAISLAGVTALQSGTDARVAAERGPAGHAVDVVAAGHDALQSSVDGTAGAFGVAADRYAALASQLADTEASLDRLGQRVAKVSGAAGALPARVSLPSIRASAPATRTKVVHATTGASG